MEGSKKIQVPPTELLQEELSLEVGVKWGYHNSSCINFTDSDWQSLSNKVAVSDNCQSNKTLSLNYKVQLIQLSGAWLCKLYLKHKEAPVAKHWHTVHSINEYTLYTFSWSLYVSVEPSHSNRCNWLTKWMAPHGRQLSGDLRKRTRVQVDWQIIVIKSEHRSKSDTEIQKGWTRLAIFHFVMTKLCWEKCKRISKQSPQSW